MSQESERLHQMTRFVFEERHQRIEQYQKIIMLADEVMALKCGFEHLDNMFRRTISFLQKNQSQTCYEKMIKEIPDLIKFLSEELK